MRPVTNVVFSLAVVLLIVPFVHADRRLKGIACRSVHLGYPAPEGRAFYTEAIVGSSAEGTYFMACGFRMGYFGMQELANGKKVILFSVWDPGKQNNPNATPKDRRVQVLFQGKGVRVRRFGGEGTGGQSFFDYDWKVGEKCRFLIRAAPNGKRTAYAAYFYLTNKKQWKHLVTFSTLASGKLLHGYYSFIEDFRRNRISTTKARRASFGNGWICNKDGKWQRLSTARFTADSNPVTNINAGSKNGRFFLATGGKTQNKDAKLRSIIRLPKQNHTKPKGLSDEPLARVGQAKPLQLQEQKLLVGNRLNKCRVLVCKLLRSERT
ncbi:MAG: DUF3472 domain-containing protein [Gemmataceae bacterium]